MNLYATDKEYKERFDYFLEEVKNDEGNKLAIRPLERNFNPRSREGSDKSCRAHCRHVSISIHAPAKGATCTRAFGCWG